MSPRPAISRIRSSPHRGIRSSSRIDPAAATRASRRRDPGHRRRGCARNRLGCHPLPDGPACRARDEIGAIGGGVVGYRIQADGRRRRAQIDAHPGGARFEPARRVGLVANSDPDRFKFSHGLVRDAVAAQVGGLKRRRSMPTSRGPTPPVTLRPWRIPFAGGGHAWQAGSELDTEMALRASRSGPCRGMAAIGLPRSGWPERAGPRGVHPPEARRRAPSAKPICGCSCSRYKP